jgi:hypothetical protein
MSTVDGGGWRLPFVKELASLIDYGRPEPNPLLSALFDQHQHVYWAQNAHGLSHYGANFTAGQVGWFLDGGTPSTEARCVRGTAPVFDFVGTGTTVQESTTQLEWVFQPTDTTSWDGARAFCAGLSLDGGGWRLPNVKELVTTVVPSDPPVLHSAFHPGPMDRYWTSTPLRGQPEAFIVDNDPPAGQFVVAFPDAVANTRAVRCVRAQP